MGFAETIVRQWRLALQKEKSDHKGKGRPVKVVVTSLSICLNISGATLCWVTMKFKTIYADPPWCFRDKLDKTRRKPYPELTLAELKNLPVKDLAADNAHLYLWVTHSHLREGLELMEVWGFTYKTVIVWDKKTKTGKDWFGLGHYFRESRELCLFGVKGKLRTLTRNTRDIFQAPRPCRHSGKPERMYEIIEKNSPPPRLELFARKKRKGWIAVGLEISKKAIKEELEELIKQIQKEEGGRHN